MNAPRMNVMVRRALRARFSCCFFRLLFICGCGGRLVVVMVDDVVVVAVPVAVLNVVDLTTAAWLVVFVDLFLVDFDASLKSSDVVG